jgi:hypothetical protein
MFLVLFVIFENNLNYHYQINFFKIILELISFRFLQGYT